MVSRKVVLSFPFQLPRALEFSADKHSSVAAFFRRYLKAWWAAATWVTSPLMMSASRLDHAGPRRVIATLRKTCAPGPTWEGMTLIGYAPLAPHPASSPGPLLTIPKGTRQVRCKIVLSRGSSVVWSAGLVIERSQVWVPAGARGECSSPGSTFCADSHFGICYHSSMWTILVILPKVQVAGYSWTHMHTTHVASSEVTL